MSSPRPTALVVEDNGAVRSLLCDVLHEWGFDVVAAATTGEEGVDLAEELRPAVVVMDFRMPGIDGLEATRRIGEGAPDARVVVISVSEGPKMESAATEAGAFAYVPKGSAGDLRRAVRRAAEAALVGSATSSARRAKDGRPGRSASG